jgi:hypothetical protein
MKEDTILNSNEIRHVLKNASNPIYSLPGFMGIIGGNKTHLSIIKISNKGLIFIEGNKETGFKHISSRHAFDSYPKDWIDYKNDKGEIINRTDYRGREVKRLDNPSRFGIELVPIFHYLEIADDVFCLKNLKNQLNKLKDIFDLYQEESDRLANKKLTYRLLLYKNTKIVHTLFPLNDRSKRKRKINYSKGKVSLVRHLCDNYFENLEIPYLDQNHIERYKIIIRRNNKTGKELIYLQVNLRNGLPFITYYVDERITKPNLDMDKYFMAFEFNDLPDFERIIKDYETSTATNNVN